MKSSPKFKKKRLSKTESNASLVKKNMNPDEFGHHDFGFGYYNNYNSHREQMVGPVLS